MPTGERKTSPSTCTYELVTNVTMGQVSLDCFGLRCSNCGRQQVGLRPPDRCPECGLKVVSA